MQSRHNLRTFTDRRSHPLDRTGANIADREDAGASRLQLSAIRTRVRAGQHKSLGIEGHAGSGEPIGIWIGAYKKEQVVYIAPHLLT